MESRSACLVAVGSVVAPLGDRLSVRVFRGRGSPVQQRERCRSDNLNDFHVSAKGSVLLRLLETEERVGKRGLTAHAKCTAWYTLDGANMAATVFVVSCWHFRLCA